MTLVSHSKTVLERQAITGSAAVESSKRLTRPQSFAPLRPAYGPGVSCASSAAAVQAPMNGIHALENKVAFWPRCHNSFERVEAVQDFAATGHKF